VKQIEFEEFFAQLRGLVLEYKPTRTELLQAIASLDRLLSSMPLGSGEVEASPRERGSL